MINNLIEFALRQRALILIAAVILVVTGIRAAINLPIDAVPDITNLQVEINTEVPALASEEVEKLVTIPMELELSGVQDMEEMRSLSKYGLSQLTLVFKEGTDIYRARQLVNERLPSIAERIPAGLSPKLAPITTGLGEIFSYTVSYRLGAKNKPGSEKEQLMQLKDVQDYIVRPLLRTVPGIAEVNAIGGYDKQFVIMPDPEKLSNAGLTFGDLADSISRNVENSGGGLVEISSEQVVVRSVTRVETLDEIANLPVKFRGDSKPILVKDVAETEVGSEIRTGSATVNGQEAVIGTALMLTGENSRTVAQAVAEKLKDIQQRVPDGIELNPIYNRSELVDRTITTVEHNLAEGAILVLVLLFIFLGNWRAALIVASAIPLSFLFAITGMFSSRISGNLMSLGAVDFGLIVDGAVVVVENVVRQLGEYQTRTGKTPTFRERMAIVLDGAKQVSHPMFFGVLIITLVYLPVLTLTGVEGKMFHPMALTVIMALIGALILTLTLIPVLCSYFLAGAFSEDNKAATFSKDLYRPILNWALNRKILVCSLGVLLFFLSLFVFTRLGAEFIPNLDEGSSMLEMVKATSISLNASTQMEKHTERAILDNVPEVANTFSKIGTAEVASDPQGANANDIYISYKPQKEWKKSEGRPQNKKEVEDAIGDVIRTHTPGQDFDFSQPIQGRFNELLEGVRADVAVKIFGDDFDVLEKLAAEIKKIVSQLPGADEAQFDQMGRTSALEVNVNREAMSRYNLNASEVNQAISTSLGGKEVGSIIESDRRYPIVVRMSENLRKETERISSLPIRTSDGALIHIGQVANISMAQRLGTILRDSGHRRVAIKIDLRTRDVQGFVNSLREKINQNIKLPTGYYIEIGGAFKNLEQASARLMIIGPTVLALILVLVYFALGSVRQTILVASGIPLAISGGIFALWFRGIPFSITAAVGFIALSGVAVLNGLVMVNYFNQLRKEGRNILQSVTEGALTRLRPVLITGLVASFGFLPMAISIGPGSEVQKPLATVVMGGILTSTFLTMLILPALYASFEKD